MAYVEPNSIIKVCRGVPLEMDYEHTVLFPSEGAQEYMIGGHAKYTYTPTTYQRVNRETIRVATKADNLYDCNYVMFQNTNFGSKWFYAFVTAVEYINNECTEISFEIDVWQTYQFDFRIDNCFVEREHSLTDNIGDNIIDEGLQTGEYVFDNYGKTGGFDHVGVMVLDASVADPGYVFEDIFQGARPFFFDAIQDASEYAALKTFLQSHLSNPEDITAIYMCPAYGISVNADHSVNVSSSPITVQSYSAITGAEAFGTYTNVKNKKLFCAPYNYFHIDNGTGQELSLRYEFFANNTPRLMFYPNIAPPATVTAYPAGYKGTSAGGGLATPSSLKTESISISGWGECSWANNTWRQGVLNTIMNTSLGLTNLGGQALTTPTPVDSTSVSVATRYNKKGEEIGKTVKQRYNRNEGAEGNNLVHSTFGLVTNAMGSLLHARMAANTVYGSANSGVGLAAHSDLTFYAGRCRITAEYAEAIDNYFNMYGYKCNKVKVPNLNTRPHWNYVKAYNCNILGESLPAPAMETIKQTLGKGITFWKSMSEVGMYGYDNSPI